MAEISATELHRLHNLVSQNPHAALRLLLGFEQQYADDINFQHNHGGFLIDIGSALEDTALVQRGIASILQIVPQSDDEQRPRAFYNLGNGYAALHSIAQRQPGFSFDPDTTPLIEEKRAYREALTDARHLDTALQAQLRINYGNCLAHLGRSLEAIAQYKAALRHAPDHPIAWGNLGIELAHFAFIAQRATLLPDASEAIRRALTDANLDEVGEIWTRAAFERVLQNVEEQMRELNVSSSTGSHTPPTFTTVRHRAFTEFCTQHQLFLNFHLEDVPCVNAVQDNVHISLLTVIDDTTTFPRLARITNEVKERYVIARLLVYEACEPPYNTQAYDQMTHYTDNLDYAVYGIRAAKLKLAFESAYNILDKVAFFINDYLNLGIPEHRIDFQFVWRDRATDPLRPTIMQRNNYHLYGLYDMSRDLARGGYYEQLRNLRNYLTHRYLVPHVESIRFLDTADGRAYHVGYNEFLTHTIDLLQLVRSAVIYLIAFLDREERVKRQNTGGIIPSLPMPSYKHYPIGPQDAPL